MGTVTLECVIHFHDFAWIYIDSEKLCGSPFFKHRKEVGRGKFDHTRLPDGTAIFVWGAVLAEKIVKAPGSYVLKGVNPVFTWPFPFRAPSWRIDFRITFFEDSVFCPRGTIGLSNIQKDARYILGY